MELTVWERFKLLEVLPKEGDFATLKIVRKMREGLSFSEEDFQRFGIKGENGRYQWAETGVTTEIPLGEKATDLIVSTLKALDSAKTLSEDYFSLYEKFIENTKE